MLPPLGPLVRETVFLPRAAARRLLGSPIGQSQTIALGALVSIAGALTAPLLAAVAGRPQLPIARLLLDNPIALACLQFAVLMAMATGIAAIGRAFGGRGSQLGALRLVVWLNAVMLGVRVLEIAAIPVAPGLATMISLVAAIWYLWVLTAFIAELHGFESMLKVLAGTLGSLVVVVVGVAIALSIAGVTPAEMR